MKKLLLPILMLFILTGNFQVNISSKLLNVIEKQNEVKIEKKEIKEADKFYKEFLKQLFYIIKSKKLIK